MVLISILILKAVYDGYYSIYHYLYREDEYYLLYMRYQ